jgi:hypothetical protein
MMVSLKRARECIGRRVRHVYTPPGVDINGVVVEVTLGGNIRIESKGQQLVCDPENLEWDDSHLSPAVVEAVRESRDYENGQVGYDPSWGGVGIIYSCAAANDDDDDHPLYVVLPIMRQVHLVTPIADPQLIYSLEEALGWAEP